MLRTTSRRRAAVVLAAVLTLSGLAAGASADSGPAYSYAVTGTTYVGGRPYSVAVDTSSHQAYVANANDYVTVLDADGQPVDVLAISRPGNIDIDESRHTAYVTSLDPRSLRLVDTGTKTLVGTILINGFPSDVAVDAERHTAFVPTSAPEQVSVVDTETRTVTGTITVGRYPTAVAVDETTHNAYVVNGIDYATGRGTVSVVSGATGLVSATIPVGTSPQAVAVDPGLHTVYVANAADDTVSVIDTQSNQVVDTIAVPDAGPGLAVDPITHAVFVGDDDDRLVRVLDGTTRRVVTDLAVGDDPDAVAVDPTTHRAFVANKSFQKSQGTVSLITATPLVRAVVTKLSRHSGSTSGGGTLVITGQHFTGASRVVFGQTRQPSFSVVSDSTIIVTVPPHPAGTVQVRVHTRGLSARTPAARYSYGDGD